MKTAEELERIPHANKFELLVTSVLSNHNKDYAAIIHSGINAQEETIKSPVDGFCQVPGSEPPRFLFVAHSKTDRDKLKNKWLYDHRTTKSSTKAKKVPVSESNDGDLLKAAREAQELKNDFPDGKFIVILTTNQRLSKCLSVVKEVYKKARELGVEVEIWEQSRLARILDSTTEGHWLRKEHLGIDAEMLSKSLLRDLCKQSLANYEKQFLTSPNSWVYREIESQIEKGTHTNKYTIQLLIGESGSGKSAAAYQILKKHLGSGGYGLWVSDELLRECISLETAIDRVLRDLYPSLLPDAGRVALRVIPEGSRLLLIVDDVNRANNPTRQVENLVNWSKPNQSEPSDSPSSFSPYFVVCPVWPQILGSISRDLKETAWVNNVFISSMTSAEGMVAVQATTSDAGMQITNTEAISLATSLGNDPILIGLFASLLSSTQPCELNSLTENVVERFIKTAIKQVSSSPDTFLEIEYRDALSSLTTFMLKNRRLFPLWKEIRNWFRESPDELTALRELTRHEKLCRLTPEKKFIFRHDRIQQTLLVESMIEILTDTNLDLDILYEPFYAEIIGRAIARSPQSQEFLRKLRNRLPLALVEAIHCLGTPTTSYHQLIIEELKEWAKSSIATGAVLESVLYVVCWTLVKTDSPAVLEVTKTFPENQLILLARLRNGCAESGIHYCVSLNRYYFEPSCDDSLREQILEQAKRHHKEKLLTELRHILKSCNATDEWRDGALTLAGFLGFPELEGDIATCWELATDKTLILRAAIWAAIQCCHIEPKKLLDPLVKYWAGLSDEKNSYWFVEELRITLGYGIHNEVVNYFIDQCHIHKSLHWSIARMCSRIDNPDVLEFLLRSVADIKRTETDPKKVSSWELILGELWLNTRSVKISQASIERLKLLWESPENDDYLKQTAFRLWQNHIESLRAIPFDSPFFYRALQKLMALEECTIKIELKALAVRSQPIEYQKHYYPSDDELLQELDELTADKYAERRVIPWLEDFGKRHSSKSRALKVVDCWLAFNPTLRGLQIAAVCIEVVGTRKDLSILDQYPIEGSPDEIAKIKESTRFAVYRRSLD